MATSTDTAAGVRMIALSEIRHDQNVRQELLAEEVDALAQSIALLGQLTPVSVRPDTENGGYLLIAGHKRYVALAQLGHTDIRAEVRPDGETEAAERAAENVVRSALNPYEEAIAVKAMLDRGLTEDGAAQALGWPKQRVTARVKLLELPEQAQQLAGQGVIPLSAVEQLRSICQVSPELLEAVIAYLGDGNEWAADRLTREPGWVIDSALRNGSSKVFAAHLTQLDGYEIADLRLGKKTEALLDEAATLHKQLDRHAYGAPAVRFTESDVDQARAAGVLVEFENARPIIVDRSLYRELSKEAIKRTVGDLRARVAEVAQERKAAKASGRPDDPEAEARRERGRELRAIAEQAHGANLDLGWGLMNGLAAVDPADMAVAKFFVFALLGADYDQSPYTQTGDRVAELAARGVRLVIEEFRTDVTKTRKDGTRGAVRIDYGDPRQPAKPIAWLWKFIDGAKTAGDLYGRALVVIAAEQYASRLVVPQSQRHSPMRWSSHKDQARKALAKVAGPHLPATIKQVEKAIAMAHAEQENATRRRDPSSRTPADGAGEPEVGTVAEAGALEDDRIDVDPYQDGLEDENLADARDMEDDLRGVAGVAGPDGAAGCDVNPGL
jgi:ParB/RepB/Spo0J family partition protein